MAFIGFGKKKGEDESTSEPTSFEEPLPPNSPPVEKVIAMRQQGFSNNQITTYLQREGYPPDLIFDAMNQANIKQGVETSTGVEQAQPYAEPALASEAPALDITRIEEITEAIIDEKWNELVKNINKIIDWKDKVESKINSMEQELKDLKGNFNSLHDAILGKIGEYDENITNLGADIRAMEKVFQKVLPTLTENVNELSRISKSFKKSPK